MKRTELLEKLELIAPALGKSKLVPLLQNFWFLKDKVLAYNDQIAISVDLDSGLHLAVPPTLVDLLDASKAQDIDISMSQKGELLIKAASSKFKLPYKAIKDGMFDMPKPDVRGLPVKIEEFIQAIHTCTMSMGEDPALPDSMGVTVVLAEKYVKFYATDNATITHTVISTPKLMSVPQSQCGKKVVLSASFCKQLLKLAKLEGPKQIDIEDDYSLFACGKVSLFGRLVKVKRPLNFDSIINSAVTAERRKQLIEVPTKLQLILERAIAVSSKTKAAMEITVEEGKVDFFTKSERGEVRDNMQMEEPHPDVWLKIDPRLFRNGYGKLPKMLLTEEALIMANGNDVYLVSASV